MDPPPKTRRRLRDPAGAGMPPADRRIQDHSSIPNADLDVDTIRAIAHLGAGSSSRVPQHVAFSVGHNGITVPHILVGDFVVPMFQNMDPDDPATSRGRSNLTFHRNMVDRLFLSNEDKTELRNLQLGPHEPRDSSDKEKDDTSLPDSTPAPDESTNKEERIIRNLKIFDKLLKEQSPKEDGASGSIKKKKRHPRLPSTSRAMNNGDKEKPSEDGEEKDVSSWVRDVMAILHAENQSQPPSQSSSHDLLPDGSADQANGNGRKIDGVLQEREARAEQSPGGAEAGPSAEEEQPAADMVEPPSGSVDTARRARRRLSRFRRPKKEAPTHQLQTPHPLASSPSEPPQTTPNLPASAFVQFPQGTPSKLRTDDRAVLLAAPPPPAPRPLPSPPPPATPPKSMNSAYLDSPNGMANPLPRQPPNPGSGHQPNGSGGMPNLVNGLLSGGHQTDMNHLWQVVQQLSDVLQENRHQTANIMNSVQQIQTRAAQEGTSPTLAQVNGDLTAATTRHQAAELNTLRAQLQSAHATITTLDASSAALRSLVADYEASLSLVLDKLRPHAHQHHDALLALHAHYNALLEKERHANLELRLEHQQWQAGLGRVAAYARTALKESADAGVGAERRVRELKAENRLLRRLAGWEEGSDSEEEEEAVREELGLH